MKKNLARILCCVLVGLVTCGAAFAVVACKKDDKPTNTGALVVTPGEQNDIISLLAGPSASETDEEYTLTVRLNDDCPDDMKAIDWSIAWKNPSSEWASGKIVTDYVTLTPTADGALTAKVAANKSGMFYTAFSEQIIITATSRVRPEIKATATVDHLKYCTLFTQTKFNLNASNIVVKFGQPISFDIDVDDSQVDGTIGYTKAEASFAGYAFTGDTQQDDPFEEIVKKYSLENLVSVGCYKLKVGTVLSMDCFLRCNDESTKNTTAYKQAYNDVVEYLKNNDITFNFAPDLFYHDFKYYTPTDHDPDSLFMALVTTKSLRLDMSDITPFDIVTSVSFVDSQIIF